MFDNQGYRHTLRIRNTYRFSTTTMVTRTRLHITFISTLPVSFCIIFVLIMNFVNFTPRNIAMWWFKKKVIWDGLGMWHVWGGNTD